MKLPSHLINKTEWTLIGPMGPQLESSFLTYSLLGVDGGAHFTNKMDVWIGDQDSFIQNPEASVVIKHPRDKDRSDLALALSLLTAKLPYQLHLWGFLGGRRDHELFNLGEVAQFLGQHPGAQAYLYNEQGKKTFHFVAQGIWKVHHQGLFSLGALAPASVEMSGQCLYPIKKDTVISALSSFGLSNEGKGEIELTTDAPAFFYFPESP